MKIYFQFGGIRFEIDSERELQIDDVLREFILPAPTEPDVMLSLSWDYANAVKPTTPPVGADSLLDHYQEGNFSFCVGKDQLLGTVSVTRYNSDFTEIHCAINEKPTLRLPTNLAAILRFYPMMAIFRHFNVLFFHASQIEYRGKGIVFTAPSGTGKTTHAHLWTGNRDARMICNDRTLIRKTEEGWSAFGYPIDGSSPISSGECAKLGAVVLLSQAPQNKIERLPLFKTAARLMPQMVFDTWNPAARASLTNDLLELLSEIPVYHFGCTPEAEAVDCLENQLISDGVIENG